MTRLAVLQAMIQEKSLAIKETRKKLQRLHEELEGLIEEVILDNQRLQLVSKK